VTAPAGPTELAPPGASVSKAGPLVQYALLAGPLLSMLDSSIMNVAVEPISRELGASLTVVQWTVSGYLLALGAGLAGTALLARRFGTLPVYRASVIAFTAASALCALAPGAGVLVGARVVQGLVAAPLVPLAMSMLLGRDSRGARAISPAAGIMLFLGPALGPTVGGALIGAVGWRGIFLINVPLGALAAVAVRYVPAAMAPGRHGARAPARRPLRPARAGPARGGPDRLATGRQPGRLGGLDGARQLGAANRRRGADGLLRRLGRTP